jgi:NAD(P)H-dependent FMN reductase
MPFVPRILAFAGSARAGSYNKKLVAAAAAAARAAGADVTLIDMADYPLPLYDADLESKDGIPPNALELKKAFREHDGFLIASPEYNGSFTPLMKNVIDWVSRPVNGEKPYSGFEGRIAGLLSASPGALGGMRSLGQLRALLENMRVMVIPDQKTLPKAHEAFAEDGTLKDEKLRTAVEAVANKLVTLIVRIHG